MAQPKRPPKRPTVGIISNSHQMNDRYQVHASGHINSIAVAEVARDPSAIKKHMRNKKVAAFYGAMGSLMAGRLEAAAAAAEAGATGAAASASSAVKS